MALRVKCPKKVSLAAGGSYIIKRLLVYRQPNKFHRYEYKEEPFCFHSSNYIALLPGPMTQYLYVWCLIIPSRFQVENCVFLYFVR